MCLKHFRRGIAAGSIALILSVTCCTKITPVPSSAPQPETGEVPQDRDAAIPQGPSPQVLASLQLTEVAQDFLKDNQPDEAIRTLERAINLNPHNGRNYYYLSEAWLMKDNLPQSLEFNRLAAVYLAEDREWMDRIKRQRERILNAR